MTAYTVLDLANRFDIDIIESKIEVSLDAAIIGGTSADLIEGDLISIWDMLHGMLLPSGNDAAYCLAEYFGLIILDLGLPPISKYSDPVTLFIAEMNKNARNLGLKDTNYASPHGLQNVANKSTAADVAKLAYKCMQEPLFKQIVQKTKYTCIGYDNDGDRKVFMWTNTNKLLGKGFNGIKTGITPSAGPCLAASFEYEENENVIIVLLNSKSPEIRWHECTRLKEYYYRMKKADFLNFDPLSEQQKTNDSPKYQSSKKVINVLKWQKPKSSANKYLTQFLICVFYIAALCKYTT